MPYFELDKERPVFPPAHFADPDGLLAVGGRMREEVLLEGYRRGIYAHHHPLKRVHWWSPDPRIVLHTSGELTDEFRERGAFEVTRNRAPEILLNLCKQRYNTPNQITPSWLSERMYRIYMSLAGKGMLYSWEAWSGTRLVGGFFGVCLGPLFFGEYAVAIQPGADTQAILTAWQDLRNQGVKLMDMHKPVARDLRLPYETMSRVAFVDTCRDIPNPLKSGTTQIEAPHG